MIEWRDSLEVALTQAKRRRALVLILFASPDRPVARKMGEEVFLSPAVEQATQPFVPVKVDADKEAELFERVIGGRGALATAVLDAGGDVVSVLTGYAEPSTVIAFLEQARQGYPRLQAARRRPKDQLALAEQYLSLGSSRRAEEIYRALVARSPDKVAHERLARLTVLRGRNLEARAHLEAAQAGGPRALFTEALILSVERRIDEAVALLERLERDDSRGADRDHRLFVLGSLRHELKADPAALALFEQLRREFPRSRWIAPAAEQIGHIKNPVPDHPH